MWQVASRIQEPEPQPVGAGLETRPDPHKKIGLNIGLPVSCGAAANTMGQALLSIGWINPAAASPGALVTVRGRGFTLSTTATVGGQPAGVRVADENTMSLTLPAGLNSGPAKIVLTNPDGKTYSAVGMLTVQ